MPIHHVLLRNFRHPRFRHPPPPPPAPGSPVRAGAGAELPGVLSGQLLLRRLQELLQPLLILSQLRDPGAEPGRVLGPGAGATPEF